jgi:hypothetical protein
MKAFEPGAVIPITIEGVRQAINEFVEEIERLKSISHVQIGGDHYQKVIQPWDAMEAWMSREQFIGYLRGNAYQVPCTMR